MASTFTWLDFSESERRRTLDVIDQFRDEDTRDELGLATIRDALADRMFPGTSTIQTRARYFLFVPWIYLALERRKVSSARAAREARKREVALIDGLLEAGETGQGVIGELARGKLQRLPSNVYWAGMRTWGILLLSRSQSEYHRWLDAYYKQLQKVPSAEEPDEGSIGSANWHPHLPEPPADFPEGVTFDLTFEEADYLADRVRQNTAGSLLDWFVRHDIEPDFDRMPWNQPTNDGLPAELRRAVDRSRYFSELMHGAALLYNLMLAESRPEFQTWREQYVERLAEWWVIVASDEFRALAQHRADFWELVEVETSHRIPVPTKSFVNRWHDLVMGIKRIEDLANDTQARELVEKRERSLKRGRARIGNDRLLQDWGGQSGAAQLDYRWPVASQIIDDIVRPLKE